MTEQPEDLVFECTLDAPPEKVWRALTIPEYLERWLTGGGKDAGSIDYALVRADRPRAITYRWREEGRANPDEPESLVTFELTPIGNGQTWFRLTHAPLALPRAANGNGASPNLMLAA